MKLRKKYSKGVFQMTRRGIKLQTVLSPWLRFCIGMAILAWAVTPLVVALLHVVW